MKHFASTLWLLSALVLLCGCGDGGRTSGPPPGPPPPVLNTSGNWQFSTTSMEGMPPLTIAGSVNQSGSSVSSAVHVDGSNCFDQLATIGLTGTLTGGNISLTSAPVAGQVIIFIGSITENPLTGAANLTGTYSIHGGCADGDQGNVTGNEIPFITNILNGTLTTSGGETFDVAADVAQDRSASSAGSFGITGTVTFSTPCFSSGTITSGVFPAGSFVIGTSVTLEIETDNGILAFHGTANPDMVEIRGDYTVSGGTCDQTGTGVLVGSSPWDY